MAQYGVTLAMTLVLGGILTAVIAKAFESEKVNEPLNMETQKSECRRETKDNMDAYAW